jgi:hypothetical protein
VDGAGRKQGAAFIKFAQLLAFVHKRWYIFVKDFSLTFIRCVVAGFDKN